MTTNSDRWKGRFFVVWTGQAFSLVSSALVRFALIWWLTVLYLEDREQPKKTKGRVPLVETVIPDG